MAEWVKMRVWIAKDPRVIAIADRLARDRRFIDWLTDPVRRRCRESAYEHVTKDVIVCIVVNGLLQVWGVANERGYVVDDDLKMAGTIDAVDAICGVPGFGEAMNGVGWVLYEDERTLVFPDFFRHNVPNRERPRTLNAEKQRRYRDRQRAALGNENGNARYQDGNETVTNDRYENRNVLRNVTRPQDSTGQESNKQQQTPLPPVTENSAGYTPGLAAAVAALRELGIGSPTDGRLAEEFPTMTPELVRQAVAGVKGGPGLMVTVLRDSLPDLIAKRDADAGWDGKLGELLDRHRAVSHDVDSAYGRLVVWEQEDRDRKLVRSLAASVGEGSTDLVRAWVVRARRPNHKDHPAYRSLTVEMVSGANP